MEWNLIFRYYCCEVLLRSIIHSNSIDGQLSEEELNMLIAHAHRRVEQLQKQIVDHENTEQQRLRAALEQHREENEKLAAEQVLQERAYLKDNVEVVKQKWVSCMFQTSVFKKLFFVKHYLVNAEDSHSPL